MKKLFSRSRLLVTLLALVTAHESFSLQETVEIKKKRSSLSEIKKKSASSQLSLGLEFFSKKHPCDLKPEELKLASLHIRAAYEEGSKEAKAYLYFIEGLKHFRGDEGQQDYDKAFKSMNAALRKGCVLAFYPLGFMYYYGEGVNKNRNEALKLWREGEKNKCAKSIYELGGDYLRRANLDRENAIHYAEIGFTLIKRAAESSDPDAIFFGGCIFAYSDADNVSDLATAQIYWKAAAALGHVRAKKYLQNMQDGKRFNYDDDKSETLLDRLRSKKLSEDSSKKINAAFSSDSRDKSSSESSSMESPKRKTRLKRATSVKMQFSLKRSSHSPEKKDAAK